MKCFTTGKLTGKLLDIYLMRTVARSAHSNNFKLMEPRNPSSWAFWKPRLT